jgi:hypothetical protein
MNLGRCDRRIDGDPPQSPRAAGYGQHFPGSEYGSWLAPRRF